MSVLGLRGWDPRRGLEGSFSKLITNRGKGAPLPTTLCRRFSLFVGTNHSANRQVGGAILALFIALFFLLRLLLQSVVYLGRLGEDEDGEEVEVIDAVTC